MGYTFNGVEYDLTPEQGEAMVATFRGDAFKMTDTVIAGVLAQYRKTVTAVIKKSAETIFSDVRAKALADETVKATMPKLNKAWERLDAAKKAADELEAIVLGRAKDIATEAGLLQDGIRLGFDSEGKIVLDPVKKAHGGSAPGTHRDNGGYKVTFLTDALLPKDTVLTCENKQDGGHQLWNLIDSTKWAGQKPYEHDGKTFYNRFFDQVIKQDGLVKVEKVAKVGSDAPKEGETKA